MPANLELKARCHDLVAARSRAEAVATEWLGVDRQIDTYFRAPGGRLKLRESSLSGGQLIPYLRPDQKAARRSDYVVIPIPEPERTRTLLSVLLGVHRVVSKRREIALYQNVRIHLDQVDGLGDFVELEAVWDGDAAGEARQAAKVAFLREQLGIVDADLVPLSYEGLLGEDSPD
jgi:predicted adenylyl cyclase CyaB